MIVFNYTYAGTIVPGYVIHDGPTLVLSKLFWHTPIYNMPPADVKAFSNFYVIATNAINRGGVTGNQA